MRWVLWVGLLAVGCGSSKTPADAGTDGGFDAGPLPTTDGGALGAACLSLDQCAGNPICGAFAGSCSVSVICAAKACAAAGGAPSIEIMSVGFGGDVPGRIDYLNVALFAPELVAGGP